MLNGFVKPVFPFALGREKCALNAEQLTCPRLLEKSPISHAQSTQKAMATEKPLTLQPQLACQSRP